jgi:hypothetical protein
MVCQGRLLLHKPQYNDCMWVGTYVGGTAETRCLPGTLPVQCESSRGNSGKKRRTTKHKQGSLIKRKNSTSLANAEGANGKPQAVCCAPVPRCCLTGSKIWGAVVSTVDTRLRSLITVRGTSLSAVTSCIQNWGRPSEPTMAPHKSRLAKSQPPRSPKRCHVRTHNPTKAATKRAGTPRGLAEARSQAAAFCTLPAARGR